MQEMLPDRLHRAVRKAVLPLAVLFLALFAFVLVSVMAPEKIGRPEPVPGYAGSQKCRACHAKEFDAWKDSHHALAQVAVDPARRGPAGEGNPDLVDRAGQLHLRMTENGAAKEYPVAWAIGVHPVVQYLTLLDRGSWHPLPWSHDAVKRDNFDVYALESPPRRPDEWGHWSARGGSWNLQCAACHVTAYEKRYDAAADRYDSRWSEPGVGCESCHGAGKDHVAWHSSTSPPPDPAGAYRMYVPRGKYEAPKDKVEGMAHSPRLPENAPLLGLCATCHARRSELADGYRPGSEWLDFYEPDLMDGAAYYPDGQVRDEDYESVSFESSVMYRKGVTCLNCHDPHTGKTVKEGNALCLQCHESKYDAPAHTMHAPASAGGKCVNCHMPVTTYMLRHPRRDHGMTRPDPVLTRERGIPNACNRCHVDRDAAWAEAAFLRHYGDGPRPARERARAIAGGRSGDASALPALHALATAAEEAPVWRASGIRLLEGWADEPETAEPLGKLLADPHPLVRAAAARSLANVRERDAMRGVEPALRRAVADPVRSVRLDAAWALRAVRDPALEPAFREVEAFHAFRADWAFVHYRRGVWARDRGDFEASVEAFRVAVRMDPAGTPSRISLASVLSVLRRDGEARQVLEEGMRLTPADADLNFSLGLLDAAEKRWPEAAARLEACLKADPDHPRAWANLAVVLYEGKAGPARIRRACEEALRQDPGRQDLVEILRNVR